MSLLKLKNTQKYEQIVLYILHKKCSIYLHISTLPTPTNWPPGPSKRSSQSFHLEALPAMSGSDAAVDAKGKEMEEKIPPVFKPSHSMAKASPLSPAHTHPVSEMGLR